MEDINAGDIDIHAIVLRLSNLEKVFKDVKTNWNLKKELSKLLTENESLQNSLYVMEVDIAEIQQYSQRDNIELANIPVDVQQKDLEIYVINLLSSINVKIQSYDIAAVHRIGRVNRNNCRKVIVRFTNRKKCYRFVKKS